MARKMTKKQLEEQLEYEARQNDQLRVENEVLRKMPKLEQNQLNTLFVSIERIADAMAHVTSHVLNNLKSR